MDKFVNTTFEYQMNTTQKRKPVTVALNALRGTTLSAVQHNDVQYYVPWEQIMDEGDYELSFTFLSRTQSVNNPTTDLPQVFLDFSDKAYIGSTNNTQNCNFIGSIRPSGLTTATNGWFFSTLGTNGPIKIKRPNMNTFRVRIIGDDLVNLFVASGTSTMNHYILTLKFTPV